MIDTVTLGFPNYTLSDDVLREFIKMTTLYPELPVLRPDSRVGLRKEKTKYNARFPVTDKYKVQVTYYPSDKFGNSKPYLLLEFSIPMIVRGTNVFMVDDIIQAAFNVNKKINDALIGFPTIDILMGNVVRIDFCFNHYVGALVPQYLDILSKLPYSHREPTKYERATVSYKSKSHSTSFYDKQRESRSPLAHGVLRQEQRINRHDKLRELVEKETGIDSAILRDFCDPSFVQKILEKDLKELQVDQESIHRYNDAQDRLIQVYGSTRGDRLFGFLHHNQGLTNKEIMERRQISRETVSGNFLLIKRAGVSRALSDSVVDLPPLSINFPLAMRRESLIRSDSST